MKTPPTDPSASDEAQFSRLAAEQPLFRALWTLIEVAMLGLGFLGLQRVFEAVWQNHLGPALTSQIGL